MTRRIVAPLGVFLILILAGCGNDDTAGGSDASTTTAAGSDCRDVVDAIVHAAERYVAGYSATPVSPDLSGGRAQPAPTTAVRDEAIDEAAFQEALAEARSQIAMRTCDPSDSRAALADGLAEIDPAGPVADAVLRRLSAGFTGQLRTEPTETVVAPGDDLHEVLARSPDGSTIRLEPGEHRFDESLVLLAGVEIVGDGRDTTTIVSTAGDAAVSAITDQLVELRGLTVRHEGDEPAAVVRAGPAASVAITDARLTGGRADAEGRGGAGILMFAIDTAASTRGTTLEMTDSELVGNEGAGAVLSGSHRASIVTTRFAQNGQCGICFLGSSDGSVEESTFEANAVAVAAVARARPTVLGSKISGGEVGVQAADDAAPAIDGLVVDGTSRAALLYTGRAAGRLDGVECRDVPYGIVVGPDVTPLIGDTDCAVARSGP